MANKNLKNQPQKSHTIDSTNPFRSIFMILIDDIVDMLFSILSTMFIFLGTHSFELRENQQDSNTHNR